MIRFEAWYMKPDFFRDGIMGVSWLKKTGSMPQVSTLNNTHVNLRSIDAEDLDDVYAKMQGDVWSPNGEARELILSKGLRHTSMSVGDVILDPISKEAWIVDNIGFIKLES